MPKNSLIQSNLNVRKQMIKIDLARSIAERMNILTRDVEALLTAFTDIVGDGQR
jgi:hypothetical protein